MSGVLVVGANGFLGRAVSDLLDTDGDAVTRADVRETEGVHALDVTDPTSIADAMRDAPTTIVHLAALGSGARGLAAGATIDPAAAVRVNVEGFVHLVRVAAEHGVRRVVWSSSTTIYGPASEYSGRVTESASLHPHLAYGATKAACEFLAPLLADQFGIEVVALRLPMVYGPGRWYGGSQAGLIDVVDAALTGKPCEVEAGTAAADWIHVDDAATALRALVRADAPRHAYHAVGHTGSLAQLASEIARHAPAVTIREVAGGAPDLPLVSDAQLRADTGWKPRFDDAASGAADYVNREQT